MLLGVAAVCSAAAVSAAYSGLRMCSRRELVAARTKRWAEKPTRSLTRMTSVKFCCWKSSSRDSEKVDGSVEAVGRGGRGGQKGSWNGATSHSVKHP